MFTTLAHAQALIEAWRCEYNEERPKKGLGELTLALYAKQLAAAFAFGARLLLGLKMFPNPVYAKNDLGLAERFDRGFAYFNATYEDHPALYLVAVLAFLFSAYRILVDQGNQRYLRLSLVSLVAAVGELLISPAIVGEITKSCDPERGR